MKLALSFTDASNSASRHTSCPRELLPVRQQDPYRRGGPFFLRHVEAVGVAHHAAALPAEASWSSLVRARTCFSSVRAATRAGPWRVCQ